MGRAGSMFLAGAIVTLVASADLRATSDYLNAREAGESLIVAGSLGDFWEEFKRGAETVFGGAAEELGLGQVERAGEETPHYSAAGLSNEECREIQQRLVDAGFNPGPVDGLPGPRTSKAIRQFQAANGLPADGIASNSFLQYLRTNMPAAPPRLSGPSGPPMRPQVSGPSAPPPLPQVSGPSAPPPLPQVSGASTPPPLPKVSGTSAPRSLPGASGPPPLPAPSNEVQYSTRPQKGVIAEGARHVAALEKWVSPQGIFSVYRPRTWKVSERYSGTGANVTVTDPSASAGVVFDTDRNTNQATDCLYRMGSIIGPMARKYPDIQFANTRASIDRSRALTDVSYSDRGNQIDGRFYCTTGPQSVLVMGLHAPRAEFAGRRPLLLTILNNINFYDEVEQKKAARARAQALRPKVKQFKMVRRRAADGSSSFLAPVHWEYAATKGTVLVGSEKEDAGFTFTIVTLSTGMGASAYAPAASIVPYQRPRVFIRTLLTSLGHRNVQVTEARTDNDPSIQMYSLKTGRRTEGEVLTVRFTSKSGRVCQAIFKVANAAPNPLTGMWESMVSGVWAQKAEFPAYLPSLIKVAESFSINQQYATNYVRSGLANLRNQQKKTQQAIQELHQARHEQQLSWEANEARRDYTNWKFSQYMRDQTSWVSELEGGKLYRTDSSGTLDTETGDYYEGEKYGYVNFEGENPRHPELEMMTEIDSFELKQKYIGEGGY